MTCNDSIISHLHPSSSQCHTHTQDSDKARPVLKLSIQTEVLITGQKELGTGQTNIVFYLRKIQNESINVINRTIHWWVRMVENLRI